MWLIALLLADDLSCSFLQSYHSPLINVSIFYGAIEGALAS